MKSNEPSMALSAPEPESPPTLLADFLELQAFMSSDGRALITELLGQQDLERDEDSIDLSDDQELLEEIGCNIIAEINRRNDVLEGAYPFAVSSDGLSLKFRQPEQWMIGDIVYLFSLVMTHAPKSQIVPPELAPLDKELTASRDLFQICSTIGAAGHCDGLAFSLGWPRADGSKFLSKLKEIWGFFGDGTPRDEPLKGSPKKVKDEGIDIVAWAPQPDGQPGTYYILGQVASGHDWEEKSVVDSIKLFHEEWFAVVPASIAIPVIFVPFLIESVDMRRYTRRYGHVLHRGRLPRLAAKALKLVASGIKPIERLEDIGNVKKWLESHRSRVMKLSAA
jgi:hypothetical protein